eukprot:scaffold17565_cov69-Phaeocystis_antarctica.AAC.5
MVSHTTRLVCYAIPLSIYLVVACASYAIILPRGTLVASFRLLLLQGCSFQCINCQKRRADRSLQTLGRLITCGRTAEERLEGRGTRRTRHERRRRTRRRRSRGAGCAWRASATARSCSRAPAAGPLS